MLPAALPLLFGAAVAASAPSPVEPTITVAWRDKPPYHYLDNGEEKGYLLARARQVFAQARIPAVFVREPVKRIWANFDNNAHNYCSIGWYMLPERMRVAQYSTPFHIDPPHVVLASHAAEHVVGAHPTLAALLADPTLSIGVVDGVSYGAQLDAMVAGARNQVVRRTVDPAALLRMVAANRVSFMLMDREDWEFASRRDPQLRELDLSTFPDMPPGQTRYIVCSKDVPAATMARLNKAVDGALAAAPRNGPPAGR